MKKRKNIRCPWCKTLLFTDKGEQLMWVVRCKNCQGKYIFNPETRDVIQTHKPERVSSAGARFY